jgi:hypothetical protein
MVDKVPKNAKLRDKWLDKLANEDKAHQVWRKRAKQAEEAYCEYSEEAAAPAFPVYYQTIQLIHGRIYGQPPKPDVRKRHPSSASPQAQANDPALGGMGAPNGAPPGQAPAPAMGQPPGQPGAQPGGMGGVPVPAPQAGLGAAPGGPSAAEDDNTIALCLERCLSYTIDTTLFDRDAHLGVNDFLVAGLGSAKVEIETEVEEIPVTNPMTGEPLLDEDGKPLQQAQITEQKVHLRHFYWGQFRWEPCKDWRRVGWVSFDHYMTRDDIEDEFGVDLGEAVPDSASTRSGEQGSSMKQPLMSKYEATWTVHEIWDKETKRRIWVSDCFPYPLDIEDDPLELDQFFPCPPPMMANVSTKELIPSPDYWEYQSLVIHASQLQTRIRELTKQLKNIYFYDPSFDQLKSAVNEYPDGAFVAVKDMIGRLKAADTSQIIVPLPMAEKAEVIDKLNQELEITKSRIYEVNGIADIQRGVSNPNDTATAQQIKNQWADIRTGQRVQVVALFFRDIFRIMAEVISKHFVRSQIEAMSGIALSDNQMATMRSELASCYAIDVESDSTMVQNDAANQEQTEGFVNAFTSLATQVIPAVQQGSLPAGLAKELLMLVKDSWKAGRQLEQEISALPDTLKQLQGMAQQNQQTQQQLQQAQQQNQDLQNKLQQADAQKNAREDAKTSADVQKTNADTARTIAQIPKDNADALAASVNASQASRQDLMEGIATGIQ